ncbi:YqhR family membrane protein [Jeotgalibacillus terrae]|uniref:YqhR family membrane protein n=1 Tax=Jeotgalibacillus terrae TaxID=587735 RepID=A0ABW5ZNC0_9BACL|nr:YqhR family membrane protein [Jeotgalibacillus terrae]MBM7577562.1 uncharacterized membrane protein (DUF485 family) [Jeotgalibacillus terrae]
MKIPTINRFPLALYTAAAGAVFFYVVYRIYVYLHFIEKDFLKPEFSFITAEWRSGAVSEILFGIMIIMVSFIWTVLYYMFFRNRSSIYPGIFSGMMVLILLLFAGWALDWRLYAPDFKMHTWFSLFSLFILYGLFTGYSVSYDEPYSAKHRDN